MHFFSSLLGEVSSRMNTTRRLVLFDIDGTLLDVKGAGRRSFAEALTLTWGITDDLADVRFAGATDLGVLEQLRARHELPAVDEDRFFLHLEQTLRRALVVEAPSVYPGVRECVAAWAQTDAVLGLLTGNARRTAHAKLEAARLDVACFDVGGYGDEHPDRAALARLAVSRAQAQSGQALDVIVVGDTANDIRAARAIAARAVAVTTGHVSRAELADADRVVDRLDEFLPDRV
jgi:phosphoglycolate phosphatase